MWCSPLKPGNIPWHPANQLPRCDASPMLAVSEKTHVTFIVVDLQLALDQPVLSRIALLPPLCRSFRFDQILLDSASAPTCVHHEKCFARWNRRYEFHAFCPSRSSATRIRSHHCFNFVILTWCLSLHTWHRHVTRHRMFVWQ